MKLNKMVLDNKKIEEAAINKCGFISSFKSEYGCQKDCRIFGACSKGRRSDNKDVIFKGVKA